MNYVHDCKICKFLGDFVYENKIYDLYICSHKPPMIDTLIARYGDDGPDYCSGAVFHKTIPMIKEAASRALAQGYVLKDYDK